MREGTDWLPAGVQEDGIKAHEEIRREKVKGKWQRQKRDTVKGNQCRDTHHADTDNRDTERTTWNNTPTARFVVQRVMMMTQEADVLLLHQEAEKKKK